MSTISANQTYRAYAPQKPPPERNPLSAAIDAEVSAGTLSQTDATALSGALDAIDASLSAERGASGSTARLDPAQMQERIDGLIDDQVEGGTLTGDQAETLKGLFAAQGGPDAVDGPPPDQAGGKGEGTGDDTASDLLASFIQQIQATQTGGYAANGAAARAQAVSLLVDFKA